MCCSSFLKPLGSDGAGQNEPPCFSPGDGVVQHSNGFGLRQYSGVFAAVVLLFFLATPTVYALDGDDDGVDDLYDNCPSDPNPDQEDFDNDLVGDACDASPEIPNDADDDTIVDLADNCPDDVNLDQSDNDEDGLGDVCDPDDDNDGAIDHEDNCPIDSNPMQEDADANGLGDACDPNFPVGYMAETVAFAMNIILEANPPGGNGLISKLTGKGGVLSRVSNAVNAFESGLIDVYTYLDELESALDKLDAFNNQLSAKTSNGQIGSMDSIALMSASGDLRLTIDSLVTATGM